MVNLADIYADVLADTRQNVEDVSKAAGLAGDPAANIEASRNVLKMLREKVTAIVRLHGGEVS